MIDIEIDDHKIRAALQNLLAATGNLDDVLEEIGEGLSLLARIARLIPHDGISKELATDCL
jgi:hypothetical protein